MARITLDQLNRSDKPAFAEALGDIYESSPWVADAAFALRPFATLAALHKTMIGVVNRAGRDQQLALIKAHPDLAGKVAQAGALTADSKAEQQSAGLDRLSPEEFAAFHRLNEAYRTKFGIPFIICVRRHTRDSILHEFERRTKNAAADEHDRALDEIFRIAALRLDQRVDAPDQLKLNGRLSTHVLDTLSGKPASGVAVELFELGARDARLILRATTNADGRTPQPLIEGRPVPIGRYELRFAIGEYFTRMNAALVDPPFLDVVPVRFAVAEAEGHYHVPLLATPWSYTTYRGS